jgi:hypothetical protein
MPRWLTTRWPSSAMPRWRPARRSSSVVPRWRSARRSSSAVPGWRSARWPSSAVSRWPSRAGSRRRWRGMMRPARLLAVPGPAAIIVAPVGTDRERHDRQPNHRAVVHHRYVGALVGITERPCIGPAAQVRRGDIAPLIVADAAHDVQWHAARQLRHDRIIRRRTRADVDGSVGISLRLRASYSG